VVASSPTVSAWELGLRLRERRELSGIRSTDVADRIGVTQSYVSEVERGKTRITKETLDKLLDVYEFDKAERRELHALRESGGQRAWWHSYTATFSAEVLRFFAYEDGAESIRTFDAGLVPGLLQTADYARAVMHGGGPNIRQAEADHRVEARMMRQRRLFGETPLHLTAVLDEGVLHHHIGGRVVMAEQLHHLVDLVEQHPDNIDLRVVPFSADCYNALSGSTFHIVTFASPKLPTLVWQETVSSTDLIDNAMGVREYSLAYDQAMKFALDREGSVALIKQIIEEFE